MAIKTKSNSLNKVLDKLKAFCTAHDNPAVIILKDDESLVYLRQAVSDAESYTGEPYTKVLDESIIIE